jgi:hypothetical protein
MENLLEEVHMQYVDANCCIIEWQDPSETLLKALHYEVFLEEVPLSCEIPFLENSAEEQLDRIQSWWFRYNMRSCFSKDSATILDHDKFLDTLRDYDVYSGDIDTAIKRALKKLGCGVIALGHVDV